MIWPILSYSTYTVLKRRPASASLLCLLFLPMLFVLGHVQSAQAAPPTLDAYKQLVAEAYAAAQRSDRIGLDERAERLLQTTSVALPDGRPVPVDNGWLRTALAQEPPAYPEIVARLGAVLDALGQPRAQVGSDALQKLAQVYEVPPFKSRTLPSAWTRFWRAVGNAIESLLRRLFASLPTPTINPNPARPLRNLSPLGWTLLAVGILLVLGIVVYAFRGVRRSMVAEAQARAEAAAEETLTTTEALDRAQADARAGNYRGAARHLYLSSLLWLADRGLLRYDRSRTNREYLRELEDTPIHDDLVPVVATFERVWYGYGSLDAEGFKAYERQVAALQAHEAPRQ